jgi:hypothetical protein
MVYLLSWRYKFVWVLAVSMFFSSRFCNSKILQGGVISITSNPQNSKTKDYASSGTYTLTCLAWVVLSGVYAPASIDIQVIGARRPRRITWYILCLMYNTSVAPFVLRGNLRDRIIVSKNRAWRWRRCADTCCPGQQIAPPGNVIVLTGKMKKFKAVPVLN